MLSIISTYLCTYVCAFVYLPYDTAIPTSKDAVFGKSLAALCTVRCVLKRLSMKILLTLLFPVFLLQWTHCFFVFQCRMQARSLMMGCLVNLATVEWTQYSYPQLDLKYRCVWVCVWVYLCTYIRMNIYVRMYNSLSIDLACCIHNMMHRYVAA